jgi:tetratricopeptide (TPR) repeat protein
MRAVVGHMYGIPELAEKRPLPGREDDILCFGSGYDHLRWEPARNTWADIVAQFPPYWKPDVYLHWSFEYNPVPLGVESADCLTVGILGDWNLGGQAMQMVAGAFDMLFADRTGGEMLRRAGYENVHYAPLWAYDPVLHRRLPDVPRDLDIVMIGNFNHAIQRERAKWLARLAKLSRKYRVLLTGGIYGKDYVRLMNRAKIVFNRSIGGAINMRAYEAPACGALLFYERENVEVRDLFTDREECVLYGEDDLEELLDYYLTNDSERERVAEAGWRKVQPHTYAAHFAGLLEQVEGHAPRARSTRVRPFLFLPPERREFQYARQWMLMPDRRNLLPAEQALDRVQAMLTGEPQHWNARACLLAEYAACLTDAAQQQALAQAGRHALSALELQPDYAAARINLANIRLALGDRQAAMGDLRQAAAQLQDVPICEDLLRGPYYPHRFGEFDVELERAWYSHRPGSDEWTEAMRLALLWRSLELLSDLAYEFERFSLAAEYAAQAAALQPSVGATRRRLARALRALGRTGEAVTEYERAWTDAPLTQEIWLELARLFEEAGLFDKCRTLLDEINTIMDGSPFYEGLRGVFSTLRASLPADCALPPTDGTLRLLAFPDWNRREQWEALIGGFARAFAPRAPVELLLRADPSLYPDIEVIFLKVERYLTGVLGIPAERVPDITLLNQPMRADERWKLFRQAAALVATGREDEIAQAEAAGLSVFTIENLHQARALLAARKAA